MAPHLAAKIQRHREELAYLERRMQTVQQELDVLLMRQEAQPTHHPRAKTCKAAGMALRSCAQSRAGGGTSCAEAGRALRRCVRHSGRNNGAVIEG